MSSLGCWTNEPGKAREQGRRDRLATVGPSEKIGRR